MLVDLRAQVAQVCVSRVVVRTRKCTEMHGYVDASAQVAPPRTLGYVCQHLSLSLYTHIYIYIYIYRERERETYM